MIDFLGSLMAGNSRSGKNTQNSKNYMMRFMKTEDGKKYTVENSDLLMKIYRHKLVHLAVAKHVILHTGRFLSWKIHDLDPKKHLMIDYNDKGILAIGDTWGIQFDGKFIVVVPKLKDEILNSVIRESDGYFAELKTSSDLQEKFTTAINQFYDPMLSD